MNKGAWWAIVPVASGVEHDLVTKPPPRSECAWNGA